MYLCDILDSLQVDRRENFDDIVCLAVERRVSDGCAIALVEVQIGIVCATTSFGDAEKLCYVVIYIGLLDVSVLGDSCEVNVSLLQHHLLSASDAWRLAILDVQIALIDNNLSLARRAPSPSHPFFPSCPSFCYRFHIVNQCCVVPRNIVVLVYYRTSTQLFLLDVRYKV